MDGIRRLSADPLHDTYGVGDFRGIRMIYQVHVIGGQLRHEVSGSIPTSWLNTLGLTLPALSRRTAGHHPRHR